MSQLSPFYSPPRRPIPAIDSLFQGSEAEVVPSSSRTRTITPNAMFPPFSPTTSYRSSWQDRVQSLARIQEREFGDIIHRAISDCQRDAERIKLELEARSRRLEEVSLELNTLRQKCDKQSLEYLENAYVTVLVDGEHLAFQQDLIAKGTEGGKQAARLITEAVQIWASTNLPATCFPVVHFKMCVSSNALIQRMTKSGRQTAQDWKDFAQAFNDAGAMLDILDCNSKSKLVATYRNDLRNRYCQRIFLGVPCEGVYKDMLDEDSHATVSSRVLMLDGDKTKYANTALNVDPLLTEVFAHLPDLVFESPETIATTMARSPSHGSVETMQSKSQGSVPSTPGLSWAATAAHPKIHTPATPVSPIVIPILPASNPSKSLSIPRNKHGQRIDARDDTIDYQEIQRIKKMKLCNIFYLQGPKHCKGNCGHPHDKPLRPEERKVLKEVARMTPCFYKHDCDDPICIYGHRCPQSKPGKNDCFYKDDCRFKGWGHGIDTNVVKVTNVKG